MRDYRKLILFAVIGAIALAIFLTIANSTNANLPEYHASDQPVSAAPSNTPELPVVRTYTGKNYTIEIPQDWEEVTKSGFDTFVHSPSGTSIQVLQEEYSPSVNGFSEQSAATYVASIGGNYVAFEIASTSNYLIVYTKDDYAYLENVFWDRKTIYRIRASVPIEYYDRMERDLLYCLKTFKFASTDPIPETHYLVYSELGNFEFAVPANYVYGASGSAASATNEETGTVYSISVTESEQDLNTLTEVQYVQLASQNKSDFILLSFANSDKKLQAAATYYLDGVQYFYAQQITQQGGYLYTLTVTGNTEYYNIDMPLFTTSIGLIRSFAEAREEESEEQNSEVTAESHPEFFEDEDGNIYYYSDEE